MAIDLVRMRKYWPYPAYFYKPVSQPCLARAKTGAIRPTEKVVCIKAGGRAFRFSGFPGLFVLCSYRLM
jgi:hypothetical protein